MNKSVVLPNTAFPGRVSHEKFKELRGKWLYVYNDEIPKVHDGPPYANGMLHMGHAINKILKDYETRVACVFGEETGFMCGWDCHGLPIEHAVEKKYGIKGVALRAKCREFAGYWIEKHKEGLVDYGLTSSIKRHYSTMEHRSEMVILKKFHELVRKGLVYRASRPVWWSYAEKTTLAEAELEYQEHDATVLDVAFEIVEGELKGVVVPIWTTTPWTLFANEGVAFGKEIKYGLYNSSGNRFIVADVLAEGFFERCGKEYVLERQIDVKELDRLSVINPVGKRVMLNVGDFVTDKDGTGFVHIAPGHGPEDFEFGKKYELPVTDAIDGSGYVIYQEFVDRFGKKRFMEVAGDVCEFFEERVLCKRKIKHESPVSWRSKVQLVYRVTPQWFVDMSKVRKPALEMIDKIEWFPKSSKDRISSMVQNRPDWCVSRQRVWGVPLGIFYDNDGVIRKDLIEKTQEFLEKRGVDAWFEKHAQIANEEGVYACTDIMDVWIESGFARYIFADLIGKQGFTTDLYIEGQDQHRGWFQSSICLSAALEDTPPCKKVMTHGFVVDKKGRKMSKSLNNGVDPAEIIGVYGPDVMRVMFLNSNIYEDLRWSQNALRDAQTQMSRFRLTMRYLLGILSVHEKADDYVEMEGLEKHILSRVAHVNEQWKVYVKGHDPKRAIKLLYDFCDKEISGLYFDVRKDLIYCSAKKDARRVGVVRCMDIIFNYFVRWLSPFAPYLTEEAWEYYPYKNTESVHELKEIDVTTRDKGIEKIYENALKIREKVNKQVELLREEKIISESHAARVEIGMECELSEEELRELCIVSSVKYTETGEVEVYQAEGKRCPRCKFRSVGLMGECCKKCDENIRKSNKEVCV